MAIGILPPILYANWSDITAAKRAIKNKYDRRNCPPCQQGYYNSDGEYETVDDPKDYT